MYLCTVKNELNMDSATSYLHLPIQDPTWVFFLVLLIILFAPLLFARLRIPHIIGLILAGVLIGEHGFNILERDTSFKLFGQVGIYYIMFLAGLEMDLMGFKRNLSKGLQFGALTAIIPFIVGYVTGYYLLHYSISASLLLACIFASHTIVSYPIVARYGLTKHPAVTIAISATMIALLFALLVLAVIVMNWRELPRVFASIFEGAFSLKAGLGALAGVALTGARRAMLVNEAGVGTAMMMHGASRNAEPVREGFVAMLGPAIDSGLVCTLTSIPIIIADCYHVEGVKGLAIAMQAYDTLIPVAGKYLLMVPVIFFAFSTMFSYSYYGRICSEWLFGKDKARYYDWFYLAMILVASVITLDVAVSIMDMAFALMSVPTMFAVFKLSPKVIKALKDYH